MAYGYPPDPKALKHESKRLRKIFFTRHPSSSLKIVKHQKNLKRGSLKKEKMEFFINDPDLSALIEKRIDDLKML